MIMTLLLHKYVPFSDSCERWDNTWTLQRPMEAPQRQQKRRSWQLARRGFCRQSSPAESTRAHAAVKTLYIQLYLAALRANLPHVLWLWLKGFALPRRLRAAIKRWWPRRGDAQNVQAGTPLEATHFRTLFSYPFSYFWLENGLRQHATVVGHPARFSSLFTWGPEEVFLPLQRLRSSHRPTFLDCLLSVLIFNSSRSLFSSLNAWRADLLIVSSYYSFSEFRTASFFRLISDSFLVRQFTFDLKLKLVRTN